jgi:hypothetical protein
MDLGSLPSTYLSSGVHAPVRGIRIPQVIRNYAVQSLSPFPLKEKNSTAGISMGVGLITDLMDK